MNSKITRSKIVLSYIGKPCFVVPTGFFHSFVPVARPMKLATPIGALSGNSVQVIFPTVVSMIAVGFAATAVCTGTFAAVLGFAGAACDPEVACPNTNDAEINRPITNVFRINARMNVPQTYKYGQRCIVRQQPA